MRGVRLQDKGVKYHVVKDLLAFMRSELTMFTTAYYEFLNYMDPVYILIFLISKVHFNINSDLRLGLGKSVWYSALLTSTYNMFLTHTKGVSLLPHQSLTI